jgi:hypothetical protein
MAFYLELRIASFCPIDVKRCDSRVHSRHYQSDVGFKLKGRPEQPTLVAHGTIYEQVHW